MPLFAGSGAWRKFYLGLVSAVYDIFNRATSGTLGVSTSGTSWRPIRGTWNAANGVATTSDAANTYPIAAVLLPKSNVTVDVTGASLGAGISFWVTDANNWWGAASAETDTYYTYYTSCNCSTYYYYTSCNCNPYTKDTSYTQYHACCSTCSVCNPLVTTYCQTVTHYNCPYTSYVNQQTYVPNCQSCGPYQGTSCATCGPYTGTTVNYFLNLYNSVAGTVTNLVSQAQSALQNSIRVVTNGLGITATAYSDAAETNSVATISYTATGAPQAPLHGIILTPTTNNQGTTLTTFNVSVNP